MCSLYIFLFYLCRRCVLNIDISLHVHRTGNVELIKKLQELGLHHPRVKKLKEAERKTSFMVNTSTVSYGVNYLKIAYETKSFGFV